MARKLRIEYPGAIYHILSRGDRREPIFKDDGDRTTFLETLAEACEKTQWRVHAYCLMPNHFHFVVETPAGNLVAGMKWMLGTYTARFNRRHRLTGHLFSGRYKSFVVDGSGNGYLRTVCDYVHLNPARAKLISPERELESFRWSSYPSYLQRPEERPMWLRVERVFGEAGVPMDSAVGRREFARRTEARRQQDHADDWRKIRRAWCFGDETFRDELVQQMSSKRGTNHFGEEWGESTAARGDRIVREELERLGWSEAELNQRRKGDAGKVGIARRLRAETTVSVAWIAQRLRMGAVSSVFNALARREGEPASSTRAVRRAPRLPISRPVSPPPVPPPLQSSDTFAPDALRVSDL